jgi:predicted Zn finger-like uncharacterized protein
MAREILCPICGATHNLAEEQLGKRVRCKKCEHAFTPGSEPRRRHYDDDEDDDFREAPRGRGRNHKRRDRDEEEDDRPRKTRALEEQARPRTEPEPGMPWSSFVILGLIVGVLLLCCGGAGLFYALLPKGAAPNKPVAPARR